MILLLLSFIIFGCFSVTICEETIESNQIENHKIKIICENQNDLNEFECFQKHFKIIEINHL